MTDPDPELPDAEPGATPRRGLFEPAGPPVIEHGPAEPAGNGAARRDLAGAASSPGAAPVIVRRRGGTPLPVTLLLTAALGGAGYYGWTHPAPAGLVAGSGGTPSAEGGSGSPLAQQVQALSGRLDVLEKQPVPGADAVASLSRKVDDLSGRLDALSTRQDQLTAQAAKAAEIAAQKTAEPPAEPASTDHTAQDVPNLEAQQQAQDMAQQKAAMAQTQTEQKAATDALDQRLAKLEAAVEARPADRPAAPAPAADAARADDAPALAALGQRLDKLEQTVSDGTTRDTTDRQAQSGDVAALAAVDQRIGKLEQQQGQAQAMAADLAQKAHDADTRAQSGDTTALAALDGRVTRLEQGEGAATGAARDATRAVRIEAASAALQSGQPLGDLPGAPPALARFATVAPPTEAALRAAYPSVADAARAASRPEVGNRSFLDRALARVQQSVVVRQGDHVIVGDPAAGVLAKAQTFVVAGDLKGAADALGGLRGPAADAVHDWVGQVDALAAARAALAGMASHG